MKTIKYFFYILLFLNLIFVFSCRTEGELLWVKKNIKGTPPACISNFLSYNKNSFYIFPLYHLKISMNYNLIYYNKEKIFDSNHTIDYKYKIIELYNNKIIIITEKVSANLPWILKRKEISLLDLTNPEFYYKCKFSLPIQIISEELIELIIKNKDKDIVEYDYVPQIPIYNFYIIKEIDLEEQIITLNKISNINGIYEIDEDGALIFSLEKYINPIYQGIEFDTLR